MVGTLNPVAAGAVAVKH